MVELQSIWAGVLAIAAAVGTLVSRFAATDPDKPFWRRLAITLDMTQVIDSTRKLDD